MHNNLSFPNLEKPKVFIFKNHEDKELKLSILKDELDIIIDNDQWWFIGTDKERFENAVRNHKGFKFWIIKFLYAIINRINSKPC